MIGESQLPGKLLSLVCAAFLAQGLAVQADEPDADLEIVKQLALGGDGSWDALRADCQARRLYISRSTTVMVVDMDAETLVGEIGDMLDVHDIALATEYNKGFISCGRENGLRIFDLKTLEKTGHVNTGKKPACALYDKHSKKVFVFNKGDKTATAIQASSGKVLGQIQLGGIPSAAVADEQGKLFVNLEDKNEVAVIDADKQNVLAHWALPQGAGPSGITIDPLNRRLFCACHNKLMVVLDADTGKYLTSLPIGAGAEAATFDPETQCAFSSNGEDGTITVIYERSPSSFSVLQNVPTQEGARTMALDTKKHQLWLASARKKLSQSPAQQSGTNSQNIEYEPGSFVALIVAKHIPVDYGVPFSRKTAAFLPNNPDGPFHDKPH